MNAADVTMVSTCLDLARDCPADQVLSDAASSAVEAHRVKHDPTPQEKQAAKDLKQQDRQEEKARKAAKKAADAADALERYGACVFDDMFGAKTVRIYDKGYVRVAFLALGSMAPYERLIDIETSVDVQKKSGLGRGVGAVLTMGVNLAGSNKRGDVWITIITEDRAHTLHEDPPTSFNIARAKKIGGMGQSVLRRAAIPVEHDQSPSTPRAPSEASPSLDMAERLRQLNSLLADGLISETEHEQKRARLLDEL